MQLETVAAISTPPGKGGVAVIRISGDDAIGIAEKCFCPKSKGTVGALPDRKAVYGDILSGGVCIDDGILTVFRAPHSYTGEDTVEISCHGGRLIQAKVLGSLLAAGAKPAGPGEFTRRAVLSGRLSLSDAEAVGALIDAETDAQLLLSAKESRSHLTKRLEEITGELLRVLSIHFSDFDFPDEDPVDSSAKTTLKWLRKIKDDIDALISTYPTGRAVSTGIRAALVGRPNVGKSSIYNALVGEDAAIVTPLAGTTRDVLEKRISIGPMLVDLSDTAGIRKSDDPIEQIGVKRSQRLLSDADAILLVLDRSEKLTQEDHRLLDLAQKSRKTPILLLSKCDLPAAFTKEELPCELSYVLEISAASGVGIEALKSLLVKLFCDEALRLGETAIVTTARQMASLSEASESLSGAIFDFANDVPTDAAVSGVERALSAVMRTSGRLVSEEVVDTIFKNFCVGK